jgi:tRNA(Arg) A34 adenosine deaminase TadA
MTEREVGFMRQALALARQVRILGRRWRITLLPVALTVGACECVIFPFSWEAGGTVSQSYEEIEVPVGCVFVRGDEVVATGYNQTNVSRNGTRHAELVAMDRLLLAPGAPSVSILSECELFVTCEPCIMCAGILRQMRIKKVNDPRWPPSVS